MVERQTVGVRQAHAADAALLHQREHDEDDERFAGRSRSEIVAVQFHVDRGLIEADHFFFDVVGVLVDGKPSAAVQVQGFDGELNIMWNVFIANVMIRYGCDDILTTF